MSGQLIYPPHWAQLRAQVLARAQHRCECVGQCGSDHDGRCNVPNHVYIVRDPQARSRWYLLEDAYKYLLDAHYWHHTYVRLMTAHMCHDSTCDDLTCLRAMCQRCHTSYDAAQHARNAAHTRRARREALGQERLRKDVP